ncbi:hypothetical protein QTP70_032305, partial [Hemibagrus guttatus]
MNRIFESSLLCDEYKELQRRVKREVSKAKQKAYEELYTRLDTREGEKDLYRLARQRDRDGKDVQQVRVIKDRDGRVLTSEESVQRKWKEYFEELMNEENEREKRVEGVNSVEQKVDKIRKDEVRKALKRMKSGKPVGPDDIPVEVWKCLGEAAVEFLTSLFNRVLESERMPEEWRRSVLVPIFKNKGDVQSCSNYRGIKLMSHTMKLWERVVEARLRKVVEICEQQYGFMPRKSTTDAIFALRILMEKYRDGQRELHCVFVDLEKAYDRVPREELWYCMRKSGVAEKYVRVVQDMYERSRTVVRCAVGQTEEFKVEVGLHQGSALSPFLFAIVMDQLSEEVRQESPWTMMFADDIVICSESREQVEENLERWRFALERRGMKVSRSKTEYMCVNEREGSGTVRLQGEEVKKVQEFKYLGSTVQSNGECGKEVKKRVQAGWNGWRKVWGVLCERKISARIKGKVYRTVVRAAMLYGLETVSLRKRQESELEVAELKMLSEQECMKQRLVLQDTEAWQKEPDFRGLERVGGVDLSFIKGDEHHACAQLVILSYPELQVVYDVSEMVYLSSPYVSGFLAFREAPPLLQLLHTLQREQPELMPQVVFVDGNGLFHYREFGLACHLGVLSDLPCVGVAKNLLQVQGVAKNDEHMSQISTLSKAGDTFPLVTDSGKILGQALRSSDRSTKPVYVSVGHRISLDTAVHLTHSCCRYRVPEPTRQ